MHLVGRHRAGPRSCSVSEDRTAGAGGILTAIFSHPADKRTESGLSEFGLPQPHPRVQRSYTGGPQHN